MTSLTNGMNKIGKNGTSSYAWLVVGLLFLGSILNYLDRITITTMRVSIMSDIPMSEAEFGILSSVFLWVYGILSPVAGYFADRFSRVRVIVGSVFAWSLVTWLTSQATTFEQLVATRALMGISEAAFIPAGLALIMDYHRENTKSLATGIMLSGNSMGSSLGFLGAWIAEKHSWHWAFHSFGFFGIVYSIMLIFLLKDVPKIKEQVSEASTKTKVSFRNAVASLVKERSFIYLLIFWGLLGFAGWIIVGWLPTYYLEQFGLSQTKAGLYATGYFYPASICGLLFGGYWADRWSRSNSRARVLVVTIGMCIAGPSVFFASISPVVLFTILFFIGYGFTKMFSSANLMPILSSFANSRYRATGYGILNLAGTILGGIGLYLAGIMRDMDIGLSLIFKIVAAILLLCAVSIYLVRPNRLIVSK